MPLALAIVGALSSARNMKYSDDKLSSGFNLLSSIYSGFSGLGGNSSFSTVEPNNILGDFGVRRNFL